jgi:hypothetical protein
MKDGVRWDAIAVARAAPGEEPGEVSTAAMNR